MHYEIRSKAGRIAGLVVLALVSLFGSSCSRGARVARILDQANRYYETGDFAKAEIEYKNVLKKDAANPQAIVRLGMIYHEQGREIRAAAYFLRARQLQPDNVDVRAKLALVHLGDGGLAAAREEALFVLQHRPTDPDAPLVLMETANDEKLLEEARQRLLALPGNAKDGAPVLLALGHIALRQNRAKDAEPLFTAAAAASPKSPAVHVGLAVLALTKKDIPAAEREFHQAADLSPARSPQRIQYARFKIQAGDIAGARSFLEETSQKAPDYLAAWLWLAEIALMQTKADDADTFLAKALALEPQHPETAFLNARIRIAKGDPGKAIPELELLQQNFPKSPQIAYQLGLAYIAAGDLNKALTRMTQVVAAAPAMSQAAFTLANLHYRKHDYPAAIAVLAPLTRQHPEYLAAQMLLAEAHRGAQHLDEAAQIYTELEKQRPTDAQLAFAHAIVLAQQNKRAEARAALEKARKLQPHHIPSLQLLVQLDLAEKAPAAARRRIEADLEQAPDSVELRMLLATVCLSQNDNAAAEAALKKAIELKPDLHSAQLELVRLYTRTHQQEKAVANLQESIRQNPKDPVSVLLLALLQHEAKDYTAARDAYEKALTLDPKSSLVLNNLAYLYSEVFDQPDKALDLAQRARAQVPNDPSTADTFGWVLAKKKQYAQALSPLQESAAKLPDEPEVQYHLGVVLYMLGDEPAARTALQRALDRNGSLAWNPDARQRLALLQIEPGKVTAAARPSLEKRLAEMPDDPVALIRVGELERRHGDAGKALAHFKTVLQANPKNAVALISVARLYAAQHDLGKAMESAKAARNAAPGDIDITYTVGRIAYEAGDHRWAASLLQDVAKARAEDPDALFDFAQAAYSVGRVADAEANLRRCLELKGFTRSSDAERFLAMMTLTASPAQAASQSAQIAQALRSEPTLLPALLAEAVAAENAADPGEAQQRYEKLLGQFPDFAPAQRNLTILYAASSADAAKASTIASKARLAFPGDVTLARAVGIVAYRQGEFARAATLLQEVTNKSKEDGEVLYYLGMTQGRMNKRNESKRTLQRALEVGLKEALANEAKKAIASAD